MNYVLIVSHGDRSGIQHAWGPYATEEDAANAWQWLQSIGIFGIGEVMPMQNRMPPTKAEQFDTDVETASSLLALGFTPQMAVDMAKTRRKDAGD